MSYYSTASQIGWLDDMDQTWREPPAARIATAPLVRKPVTRGIVRRQSTAVISVLDALRPAEVKRIVQNRDTLETLVQIVRERLGFTSARRVRELGELASDWDGNDANSLRPESSALVAAFLQSMKEFPTAPSIFLTRDGFLAMSWEDRNGHSVDITFETASYRIDSHQLSGCFAVKWPQQLRDLARSLEQ